MTETTNGIQHDFRFARIVRSEAAEQEAKAIISETDVEAARRGSPGPRGAIETPSLPHGRCRGLVRPSIPARYALDTAQRLVHFLDMAHP